MSKGAEEGLRIDLGLLDKKVDVPGQARVAVPSHRVTSDEDIFNFICFERRDELLKVL